MYDRSSNINNKLYAECDNLLFWQYMLEKGQRIPTGGKCGENSSTLKMHISFSKNKKKSNS
jgi:hypothetical protein